MIGTTLAHYRITAALGAGGMGEVWRATDDTRLGREVALKVLPEGFTADPGHLARFEREAEGLTGLNHPNSGHLHGLESAAAYPETGPGPSHQDQSSSKAELPAGGAGGNSKLRIQNSELPAAAGSGPEPRASSHSSRPAAGTAAPQGAPSDGNAIVGHASRVPGGGGGVE